MRCAQCGLDHYHEEGLFLCTPCAETVRDQLNFLEIVVKTLLRRFGGIFRFSDEDVQESPNYILNSWEDEAPAPKKGYYIMVDKDRKDRLN